MMAKPSTGTLPAEAEQALPAVQTKPNKWHYIARYMYYTKIAPFFWSPKQWIEWGADNERGPWPHWILYLIFQCVILGLPFGYFYGLDAFTKISTISILVFVMFSTILDISLINSDNSDIPLIQNMDLSEFRYNQVKKSCKNTFYLCLTPFQLLSTGLRTQKWIFQAVIIAFMSLVELITSIPRFFVGPIKCIYSVVFRIPSYLAELTNEWAERGQKIGQIEEKDEQQRR